MNRLANISSQLSNKTLECVRNVTLSYSGEPFREEKIREICYAKEERTGGKSSFNVCSSNDSEAIVNGIMFGTAILLLLIMTCCVQRRRRACRRCCWGFPGPVVPLNMLDNYENRIGYMLSFGITISAVLSVFSGNDGNLLGTYLTEIIKEIESEYSFISVFVKIALSVYVAVMTYPYFVAQNLQNKLIGSLLGLIFCIIGSSFKGYKLHLMITVCYVRKTDEEEYEFLLSLIAVFVEIPMLICIVLLMVKFLIEIYKTSKLRAQKRRNGTVVNWIFENDIDWRDQYMYHHVQEVFQKHHKKKNMENSQYYDDDDDDDISTKDKVIKILKSVFYEVKPGFMYSTRVIASTFIAVLSVYMIGVLAGGGGYVVFYVFWEEILNSRIMKVVSVETSIPIQTYEYYLRALSVSYWISMGLSIFFFAIVTVNSLTWYRRHILLLREGERTFLPDDARSSQLDATSLMTASFKYAGYQVAYCIWGFLLSLFVILLIVYFVYVALILPLIRGELSFFLLFLIDYWPTLLLTMVMIYGQKYMAMCCFITDRNSLGVDNRRAYHIMSYFLFYFNIFLGLTSCLLRVVYGLLFGVIFLQRLSRSTLSRPYEIMDPGFFAYVGFLLSEHQHANPVLQCFVRLLLETQGMELKDDSFYNRGGKSVSSSDIFLVESDDWSQNIVARKYDIYKRTRQRNRWHLFVVLSLNPSITKYRQHHIISRKKISFVTSKILSIFDDIGDSLDKDGALQQQQYGDGKTNMSTQMGDVNSTSIIRTLNYNNKESRVKESKPEGKPKIQGEKVNKEKFDGSRNNNSRASLSGSVKSNTSNNENIDKNISGAIETPIEESKSSPTPSNNNKNDNNISKESRFMNCLPPL